MGEEQRMLGRGTPSRRHVLALLSALAAGACALALMEVSHSRASELEEVGQLTRISGLVTVHRGVVLSQGATGMRLRRGDRIATGSGGRAEMTLADGSRVTVGEESEVVVASFLTQQRGARAAVIELLKGIVRAVVPAGNWDRFEIRTATAIASVRSTDWLVDFDGNRTGVFVFSGGVGVTDPSGAGGVLLQPRQGSDVVRGQLPTRPVEWGQPRIDASLARLKFD
ncbi:MAG: FecR domain-containing protein [Alphaproteobacteria bacterium]|nr:FecR domain-containing protein [Alphaproteobacteria bacterium]